MHVQVFSKEKVKLLFFIKHFDLERYDNPHFYYLYFAFFFIFEKLEFNDLQEKQVTHNILLLPLFFFVFCYLSLFFLRQPIRTCSGGNP